MGKNLIALIAAAPLVFGCIGSDVYESPKDQPSIYPEYGGVRLLKMDGDKRLFLNPFPEDTLGRGVANQKFLIGDKMVHYTRTLVGNGSGIKTSIRLDHFYEGEDGEIEGSLSVSWFDLDGAGPEGQVEFDEMRVFSPSSENVLEAREGYQGPEFDFVREIPYEYLERIRKYNLRCLGSTNEECKNENNHLF